jgi:hypothetical protein
VVREQGKQHSNRKGLQVSNLIQTRFSHRT